MDQNYAEMSFQKESKANFVRNEPKNVRDTFEFNINDFKNESLQANHLNVHETKNITRDQGD